MEVPGGASPVSLSRTYLVSVSNCQLPLMLLQPFVLGCWWRQPPPQSSSGAHDSHLQLPSTGHPEPHAPPWEGLSMTRVTPQVNRDISQFSGFSLQPARGLCLPCMGPVDCGAQRPRIRTSGSVQYPVPQPGRFCKFSPSDQQLYPGEWKSTLKSQS